ncbi:sigma-70 family RNA polymerase sigma factor [Jeotgalibacillus aurantiacus]|uniref:sigma-70 family RNA polymerase sigma factor n=1 Tax=Jeotgalibacillus aurantiacus TaxID=2763266 RepID=UPI001D0BC902|nr:sigma-70 family RNA polymerase sigma factor [Jeotgalibacillus aurantiacus]
MNGSGLDRHTGLEWAMNEYGTSIKRFIYSYVKNWETAGDLAQDVFVTVYEKWATFEGRSSFKTWIFTIAANRSKDYLRSWHYRKISLSYSMADWGGSYDSAEAEVEQKENVQAVLSVMMTLPVKYREILLLHHDQDLNYQEMAEILSLPVSTVKTRIRRGHEKVRKSFLPEHRGISHE